MKIKNSDTVEVIAGKDKNRKGKITKVIPKENRIVVEGVNIIKKHIKRKKGEEKGQKISVALPIDASNVALICPKCSKRTRVGYLVLENGEKHRICKKCNREVDNKATAKQ